MEDVPHKVLADDLRDSLPLNYSSRPNLLDVIEITNAIEMLIANENCSASELRSTNLPTRDYCFIIICLSGLRYHKYIDNIKIRIFFSYVRR